MVADFTYAPEPRGLRLPARPRSCRARGRRRPDLRLLVAGRGLDDAAGRRRARRACSASSTRSRPLYAIGGLRRRAAADRRRLAAEVRRGARLRAAGGGDAARRRRARRRRPGSTTSRAPTAPGFARALLTALERRVRAVGCRRPGAGRARVLDRGPGREAGGVSDALDAARSARLLFGAELQSGAVTAEALDVPAVRSATRARAARAAPVRLLQRLAMKTGRLSYQSASAAPMQAARRAVLGARADGPPRFLIRVDEFPHYQALNVPVAVRHGAVPALPRDHGGRPRAVHDRRPPHPRQPPAVLRTRRAGGRSTRTRSSSCRRWATTTSSSACTATTTRAARRTRAGGPSSAAARRSRWRCC